MNKHVGVLRGAAVAVGAVLLVGVAGAAFADDELGADEVEVGVSIAPLVEPGVLALTVESTSTTLVEEGSTDTVRQFLGELPTVTVTDTRTADEITDGAAWYVVGSSTDFIGDNGRSIDASYLGWTPRLLDGGESGLVAAGDQVDTVLDEGPDAVGLVDQELLAIAADSEAIAGEGQWTASADLFLRTPVTVQPGNYVARLTLSLFE